MFRLGSNASKLGKRIKQEEIEDDPHSLSARAFRQRILEEEVIDPLAGGLAGREVKVAVYRDKSSRWRRGLLRFVLVFLAPVLAIGLILLLVVNVVNENKPVVINQAESVVLGNAPVPAGVRAISRAANLNQKKSAEIYFTRVLGGYSMDYKGAATYISARSRDEIKKFYDSKLVEPKPPPWQIYGNPVTVSEFYTVLYLRALPNGPPGSLEALVLQVEPVNLSILKKDPEYYDVQAKEGENVIILWKAFLVPKS